MHGRIPRSLLAPSELALEVLHGDLFEPLRGRRFDLIVSNPPCIPEPPGDTRGGAARAWDAGPDGRVFIDRIRECGEPRIRLRFAHDDVMIYSLFTGLCDASTAGRRPDRRATVELSPVGQRDTATVLHARM